MSDEPRVSCVVPVYNGERWIREALDSIRAQTHPVFEVIVADDGSTDATRDVVAAYEGEVRLLTQSNAGPPATRNLGLRAARGELIAFLDADDLWHRDKLARQVSRLRERPEIGASVTQVRNFWIPELKEEEQQFRADPRSTAVPGYVTSALLARRNAFEIAGPFDESLWYADAGDWFLRAESAGIVVELLPEVLAFHRMHENNLSRRRGAETRQEFVRLVKRALDQRRRGNQGAQPPKSFDTRDD